MAGTRCWALTVFWLLAGMSSFAAASDDRFESLMLMDIDELMHVPVVTASRHAQASSRAPAVITVLDGEDLRRRGFRSVGEALREVPGLHLIDDGVGTYTVMRGVGAGQRAYARTLKVMLDGQPLGFRSDATQFLGPELVPLSLVERVEIVRGPASALYGADAYLGVINVITRRSLPPARVKVQLGQAEGADPSAGFDVLASSERGDWQAVASAVFLDEDRSGRTLPSSSPRAAVFADTVSRTDHARPAGGYARVRHAQENLDQRLVVHVSELDSDGEFLDFGALTHRNRIHLVQQTFAWQGEWKPEDDQRLHWRVARAEGGVGEGEQLTLGLPGSHPERDLGYAAWDLALEGQWEFAAHHVVLGTDGSWDEEEPFDVFSVNEATGLRTQLSTPQPARLFRNIGGFVQYQWQAPDAPWLLALNWRHDSHNRYGEHDSYRVGLTGEFSPRLLGKLLYGTAFKAPNAFQLYAQPLYTGDSLGNVQLLPERARTLEGQLVWEAQRELWLTFTAYTMAVDRLIELQPFGVNQRWSNRGEEEGHGLESELRWRLGHHRISAASVWQQTQVRFEQPLLPVVETSTASAPRLLTRVDWRYALPETEFGMSVRVVSERRASDSNIDLNLRQAYTLPSYAVARAHAFRRIGGHRLGVVLDNLADAEWAEPGYGGVDLPSPRRTLWLSWAWQPAAPAGGQ